VADNEINARNVSLYAHDGIQFNNEGRKALVRALKHHLNERISLKPYRGYRYKVDFRDVDRYVTNSGGDRRHDSPSYRGRGGSPMSGANSGGDRHGSPGYRGRAGSPMSGANSGGDRIHDSPSYRGRGGSPMSGANSGGDRRHGSPGYRGRAGSPMSGANSGGDRRHGSPSYRGRAGSPMSGASYDGRRVITNARINPDKLETTRNQPWIPDQQGRQRDISEMLQKILELVQN
jgi:hypothetical protein